MNIHEHLRSRNSDMGWEPPHECIPTDTRPGTAERVKVYISRLQRGENLFHPDDLKLTRPVSWAEKMEG